MGHARIRGSRGWVTARGHPAVRVTLQNEHENPVKGKTLTCDLMALINDVTISPFAPLWFPDVVSGAIEKFGYSFEVRQSELLEEPFF